MSRSADLIDRLALLLSRSHVTAYLRLFGGLAGVGVTDHDAACRMLAGMPDARESRSEYYRAVARELVAAGVACGACGGPGETTGPADETIDPVPETIPPQVAAATPAVETEAPVAAADPEPPRTLKVGNVTLAVQPPRKGKRATTTKKGMFE